MKAISPIISIIILLLITIAIAGAGYSYLSVYWTGMTSKQIQLLDFYCTNNRATITLRNIGTSGINNSYHEAMLGLFEPDDDTVGMWHFDETDGNASLDSSGQGNTGTIFGDTVLLMHFDEDDGNATLDSTSYGNTGTLYGDTVLLMHFDNGSGSTTDDETSYGNDGTIVGAEWKCASDDSDYTPSGKGCSLEFDGVDNRINVISSGSLNLNGKNEVTLVAWIYPIGGAETWHAIISKGTGQQYAITLNRPGTYIHFETNQMSGGSCGATNTNSGTVTLNDWNYVVATYNGSLKKVYINGVERASASCSLNFADNTQDLEIGRDGNSEEFNGTIDEVAIYSKALSQEEIEALYDAGRAKFIERKLGRSGNAIEFDGDGDKIQISNSLGLSGPFTFSHWIKTTQTAGQVYTIGNAGGGNGYRFGISGGKIAFLIGNSTGHTESANCGMKTINDGNWHLITGIYDRGNAFYCYVDGVLNGSVSIPFYEGMSNSAPSIGAPPCCTDFNGTIDEVAIYSRALTADEVKAHYEAGKAKFIEHVEGRFGYGMEFDGDGDFINISYDNSLNITEAITISAWIKSNAVGYILAREGTVAAGESIEVTQPNGGEILTAGTMYADYITWTASGWDGENVNIEYSSNSGDDWSAANVGASSCTAGSCSASWITPAGPPTSNYLINITKSDDAGVTDESDAVFTLQSPPPSPFIYIFNGKSYEWLSDFIAGATSKEKEYTSFTDITGTEIVDGKVKLKITEELDETAYIDKVYLRIDENDNKIIELGSINDADINLLKESDDEYLVMEQGDEYYLEFEISEKYSKLEFAAEGYYIMINSENNNPIITNAYVEPTDVRPGDKMLVSADVRDEAGIRSVIAEMPHEKGVDVLDLELVEGTKYKGTWQNTWNVHDTIEKGYVTKIIAENEKGESYEADVYWTDPSYDKVPFALNTKNGGEFLIINNSVIYNASAGGDINDGNWHHISATYNGSDMRLYVDGVLKATNTSYSGDLPTNSGDLWIGANYSNSTQANFNGTIDEVLIFNRSLSAEEIQAQLKPACSCSGSTCQCGELTVSRTSGEGYFHPYFDNETFSPGQTLTMTDYNCLGGRCEYRITSPTGSYERTVFCS